MIDQSGIPGLNVAPELLGSAGHTGGVVPRRDDGISLLVLDWFDGQTLQSHGDEKE